MAGSIYALLGDIVSLFPCGSKHTPKGHIENAICPFSLLFSFPENNHPQKKLSQNLSYILSTGQ
jgi:hypothetical protein